MLSWLFTLDHKRIGLMYMVSVLAAFLLGGVFAMLIRMELMYPNKVAESQAAQTTLVPREIFSKDAYNQIFTIHGTVMIFLFIIPAVPAIFGNFMLPLMLGAKDVAFPRLNLLSLWLWWAGAVFFLITLLSGGLDTGWTFYTPYSTETSTKVLPALTGVFILGFSSIFTGINFIVSIHTLRPPE